jgi:RHS repeat-associated protein
MKMNSQRIFAVVLAGNLLFSTVPVSALSPQTAIKQPARAVPALPKPPSMPHRKLPAKGTIQKTSVVKKAAIPKPAMPPSVKRGPKKVRLFESKVSFSGDPTDLELSTARVFQDSLIPTKASPVAGENQALAKALLSHKKRTNPEDVSDLTNFIAAFPKSRWRPSIELNLGMRRLETGYLTDALNFWKSAWESTKDAQKGKAKLLADCVIGNLVILEARLGRKAELKEHLDEISKRTLSASAASKVHDAQDGLACMETKPEIAFKCGPYALNSLLSVKTKKPVHSPLVFKAKSTENGTNLLQLKNWADQLGLKYQAAKRSRGSIFIVPSVMHWKLGHFATLIQKEGNRYRLKDPTFGTGGNIALSSTALETETDGFFLVPKGPLPQGWRAITETEAKSVWGKGYSNSRDPKESCQPKQAMGPGDNCECGMARAYAYGMQATLNIQDIPLSYTPPIGPKMDFLVNYNHLEENAISIPPFACLGSSYWTLNWISYLTVDSSSNVTVITRGGGSEYFPYPYQPNLYSQAKLVNVSSGVYQRQLPDGSIEIFNQSDSAGRIFMTEVDDPQGNSATVQYDTNFRITSITDAIGQQTTLTYGSNTIGASNYYVITQITDPFSRSCTFTYNGPSSGAYSLASITDVVGLSSSFHYSGTLVDYMTTPYGTTCFHVFPVSAGIYNGLQFLFPDGTTSLIINPMGYVSRTFFWDREAMMLHPTDFLQVLSGSYTASYCKLTKWCFSGGPFPDYVETAVPYYVIPPLENQITYSYPGGAPEPGNPDYYIMGTMNLPSSITRTVSGATTQTWQYTYNSFGQLTQSMDPVGRTFSYTYDSNGIDLIEKDQTASATHDINGIWSGYSQHLPTSYKDGSGQVTSSTYNSFGELQTLTNPNSDVWTYTHDSNGYLTQIQGPLSGTSDVTNISYDGYGRVYQVTNSEGYTVTYSYDAANRVTQVTYPDGTSNTIVYDKLDAVLLTDRLGRVTQRSYDAMDQLAYEVDPQARKTQYTWCACGSLMSLKDPNGDTTSWQHDLEGRVIQKSYADQTTCSYSYDAVGRKSSRTDAIGQTTNYSYNLDNTLYQVSYSGAVNPTSTVTYSYDPYYLRLSSVANGWGTDSYTYNPYITSSSSTTTGAGKVATATNSVISSSDVSYSYDAVGRVTNRSINGSSNSTTWSYDAMSRITSEVNPLGTFNYAYVDDVSGHSKGTTRLSSISYPNGQTTYFNWFGNLGDQRLQGILNLKNDGTCISQFNYGYDPAGQITTWQQQQGPLNNKLYTINYDLAGQLTSANAGYYGYLTTDYSSSYLYSYDPGANRIGAQQRTNVLGTIGGTPTAGDVLTITVYDAGLSGGQESVSYTVQPGDDLAAINNGLMTAFNADSTLQALGVSAGWGGADFNLQSISTNVTTFSGSLSSGATETITFGLPNNNSIPNATIVGTPTPGDVLTITVHDPALSGGQESVSYTVQSGDGLTDIGLQLALAINADTSLAAINVSTYWYMGIENTLLIASNSGNVTTYTQSISTGATESIVFSLNQNSIMYAPVSGTPTAGDTLTVTVYDPAYSGGSESATYAVQSGDGLNDIATGLANALNAVTDIYNTLNVYTDGGSTLILQSISINSTSYRATTNSGATETILLGTQVNHTNSALASTQYQYNNVNALVSIGNGGMTQFQGTTDKPVISGNVVTNAISIQQTPPNSTTYGTPQNSTATETVTWGQAINGNGSADIGGTVTTGDVVSILVYNSSLPHGREQVDYTVVSGDTTSSIASGLASTVNGDTNLIALGMSASSSSATLTILQPSTTYSASASSGATEGIGLGNNNNGNLVAEIDGVPTSGDTLTLTTNDPRLSGGTESVTYTVTGTDTVTTIASGLAALINGDTNLSNIGVTANYNAPATMSWSKEFKANQLTPGWNASVMSATDAASNTATAQYGIFTQAPIAAIPNYDLTGNMTSDGTNAYKYDAENRLVEIDYPGTGNSSQLTYDGLGQNVQIVENVGGTITSTRQFVWSGNNRSEERDASGSTTKQFYTLGQSNLGTKYFYTLDNLGSVRETTDVSTNIVSSQTYDPFGRASSNANSFMPDYGYAGYYLSVRSGLSLTKYRALSCALGRWITRDPIGYRGTTNYTYVGNAPIGSIDSLGLKENPTRDSGIGQIASLLPIMQNQYCTCRCIDKELIPQCRNDALYIVSELMAAWSGYYGKGNHGNKGDRIGGYFCWDWADLFVYTVESVPSNIWSATWRRFDSNTSLDRHYAAMIFIVHPKTADCYVTLDDGFSLGNMVHMPGWPSSDTYHELPGDNARPTPATGIYPSL